MGEAGQGSSGCLSRWKACGGDREGRAPEVSRSHAASRRRELMLESLLHADRPASIASDGTLLGALERA